jgi:hypothetical protein
MSTYLCPCGSWTCQHPSSCGSCAPPPCSACRDPRRTTRRRGDGGRRPCGGRPSCRVGIAAARYHPSRCRTWRDCIVGGDVRLRGGQRKTRRACSRAARRYLARTASPALHEADTLLLAWSRPCAYAEVDRDEARPGACVECVEWGRTLGPRRVTRWDHGCRRRPESRCLERSEAATPPSRVPAGIRVVEATIRA